MVVLGPKSIDNFNLRLLVERLRSTANNRSLSEERQLDQMEIVLKKELSPS